MVITCLFNVIAFIIHGPATSLKVGCGFEIIKNKNNYGFKTLQNAKLLMHF